MMKGGDEQTNEQTNGRTKVPLCSTGLCPLRGRCPKRAFLTQKWLSCVLLGQTSAILREVSASSIGSEQNRGKKK